MASSCCNGTVPFVALLAEGVDRNYKGLRKYEKAPWSPSSRRAWIEIRAGFYFAHREVVALLAEGVDRNLLCQQLCEQGGVALLAEGVDRNRFLPRSMQKPWRSPSSRRAWIEILVCRTRFPTRSVALLAEGVDRNAFLFRLH